MFQWKHSEEGLIFEYLNFIDLQRDNVIRFVCIRELSLELCCSKKCKKFLSLKSTFESWTGEASTQDRWEQVMHKYDCMNKQVFFLCSQKWQWLNFKLKVKFLITCNEHRIFNGFKLKFLPISFPVFEFYLCITVKM